MNFFHECQIIFVLEDHEITVHYLDADKADSTIILLQKPELK
jgi:hypothetical protein